MADEVTSLSFVVEPVGGLTGREGYALAREIERLLRGHPLVRTADLTCVESVSAEGEVA